MTTTVKATYKNGSIILAEPLSIPENTQVQVTIEFGDAERDLWLRISEEALIKTWDNPGDDVFNELLQK